jgi:glycolate dehydrogenase iron-sulfur subunit
MQTKLAVFVKNKPEYQELESILRSCVHCGFCLATCPTYQLLGDELDGPRGRIYLLKQMLEGNAVSRLTQGHLDRCLSCRSCETTCPSGVRYGRLLDIGLEMVEAKVARPFPETLQRKLIQMIFPFSRRFARIIKIGRWVKPLLPEAMQRMLPEKPVATLWPESNHGRMMLVLAGCVQSVIAPSIDSITAQVLDKLGISLMSVPASGCCGALSYHMSDHCQAQEFARNNIDACWPYIEQGAEAIVMTASGCGVMVKDYGVLLQYDSDYAAKAKKFASLAKDISEIITTEGAAVFKSQRQQTIAFQSPCTLQHGQKLPGVVETILQEVGYSLKVIKDAHFCCGSAGVYSLLQPVLSNILLKNKLEALEQQKPDIIATANIGCLQHLQSASSTKVLHWIELLL